MTTTKSYTAVSAAWVAPTPTSNGSSISDDATWIGIGGVTSGDLIQVGTQNTVSRGGQITTSAFYEMLPASSITIPSFTVSPGDDITASVNQASPGQWAITINDLTDNQTFSINVAYASTNSSAEWIEEDPSFTNGRLVPFDDFGVAAFSNCLTTANGSSINVANSSPDSITMLNSQGHPEAAPSALNSGGSGFSVNWHSP